MSQATEIFENMRSALTSAKENEREREGEREREMEDDKKEGKGL